MYHYTNMVRLCLGSVVIRPNQKSATWDCSILQVVVVVMVVLVAAICGISREPNKPIRQVIILVDYIGPSNTSH
jgi:hypothetical protein